MSFTQERKKGLTEENDLAHCKFESLFIHGWLNQWIIDILYIPETSFSGRWMSFFMHY